MCWHASRVFRKALKPKVVAGGPSSGIRAQERMRMGAFGFGGELHWDLEGGILGVPWTLMRPCDADLCKRFSLFAPPPTPPTESDEDVIHFPTSKKKRPNLDFVSRRSDWWQPRCIKSRLLWRSIFNKVAVMFYSLAVAEDSFHRLALPSATALTKRAGTLVSGATTFFFRTSHEDIAAVS